MPLPISATALAQKGDWQVCGDQKSVHAGTAVGANREIGEVTLPHRGRAS